MKPTLYLIPGLLTNEVIYRGLQQEFDIPTKVLEFIPAHKNESLQSYAKRLAEGIDTSKPFYLAGTSFGGVLATEIAKFTKPKRVILISSAKTKSELKWFMKWKWIGSILPIIPAVLIRILFVWGFILASKFVKSYRIINKPEIKEMLFGIDGKFERWVMRRFTLWENNEYPPDVVHIHGDKDHVFPIKNIKQPVVVKEGTHGMIITKYKEIARIIKEKIPELNVPS